MTDNGIHISIIIPVYNSEGFIVRTLDEMDTFIRTLSVGTELVAVDDGSSDGTLKVMKEWAAKDRPYNVQVLSCKDNLGKGAAVATGMLAARGKFRIFLDADLAYPPSQILRILEALEDGNDVATACRVHKDSRYTISPAFFNYLFTRHIASRIINRLLRLTIIKHSTDSQAGLKGFTERAAKEIFSRQRISGFPFDVEALFLAERLHYRIREVPVEFRYFNEPTTVVFMQDGMSMGRDVLRIRLNHLKGEYKLPALSCEKRLAVNADDFGMTVPISRGILKTISSGIVRSVSAMTNSPEFEASMDEIVSSHAHIDVGLHATLTWGRPLSAPAAIPSLVDGEGNFLSRNALLKRSLLGKISEDEVYLELKAQCERLATRHPEISHLDGHHHVHTFPIVCKAAERVAREFGIRYIRSPREGSWSPWYRAAIRRLVTGLLSASAPAYWRSRGFTTSNHFGGYSLSAGPDLKKRWLMTIERLPLGLTEIMAHPGYPSKCNDSYNEARESEIDVLTCKEIAEGLKKNNVVLTAVSGA